FPEKSRYITVLQSGFTHLLLAHKRLCRLFSGLYRGYAVMKDSSYFRYCRKRLGHGSLYLAQSSHDLCSGLWACCGILLQQLHYELSKCLWQVRTNLFNRKWLLAHMLQCYCCGCRRIEEWFSSQHLIKDHTQTVDIRARIQLVPCRL